MNKELKEKWVTALRSGEYKQTKSVLVSYTDDGAEYCCLGVLCEVGGAKRGDNTALFFDPLASEEEIYVGRHKMWTSLSDGLREKWGLSEDEQDSAMEMNDAHNKTFNEIAEWIEKTL